LKNIYLNRFLFVVVLLIWGVLIYKIVNVNTYGVGLNEPSKKRKQIQKDSIYLDTFILKELQRDPFFKKVLNKKKNNKSSKVKKKYFPVLSKNKTNNKLPSIEYLGYVMNVKSKIPLVLVRINHKLYKEKLYTTIKGVYLKKIITDTLLVSFSGNEILCKQE